jgi:hypothetical protein
LPHRRSFSNTRLNVDVDVRVGPFVFPYNAVDRYQAPLIVSGWAVMREGRSDEKD